MSHKYATLRQTKEQMQLTQSYFKICSPVTTFKNMSASLLIVFNAAHI
jgi:hypothetical protein